LILSVNAALTIKAQGQKLTARENEVAIVGKPMHSPEVKRNLIRISILAL
jgi:hypothetical protein